MLTAITLISTRTLSSYWRNTQIERANRPKSSQGSVGAEENLALDSLWAKRSRSKCSSHWMGKQCNYNFTSQTRDAALSLCRIATSREHVCIYMETWCHTNWWKHVKTQERELNTLALRGGRTITEEFSSLFPWVCFSVLI